MPKLKKGSLISDADTIFYLGVNTGVGRLNTGSALTAATMAKVLKKLKA